MKEPSNIAVFDLGTAKEPFKVDLSLRLCVSDIGISSSDIYKGVRLLSALYEGHPINSENFLIMQEFVPLEHGKCNH